MKDFGHGKCQATREGTLLIEVSDIKPEGRVIVVPDEMQEKGIIIGRNVLTWPGVRFTHEGNSKHRKGRNGKRGARNSEY